MHKVLSDLINVYESLNMMSRVTNIKADIDFLEHEKFSLVVVGEFSRGKSTFINAILGSKILPSSKNPTTAVISKIVYADEPMYIVHYLNGDSKEITEKEFLDIKARVDDDIVIIDQLKKAINSTKSISEISSIDIKYPLDFCKENVEVVDTPGVNDLNLMRVDITYNYLRKADAAILLLSATQLLTQSELTFLKEQILGNQIHDIFIVINGKDHCKNKDEEQRLLNYVKNNLCTVIKKDFPVYILSSKQALTMRRLLKGENISPKLLRGLPDNIVDTGFVSFEKDLEKFLDQDQGKTKIRKYVLRAKKYIDELEKHIQLQFSKIDASVDDVKEELFEYQPKVKKAKLRVRHIVDNLKARMDSHEPEIVNLCKTSYNEMKAVALNAIDGCEDDISPNSIEKNINASISPVQNKLAKQMHEMQNEWFANEFNFVVLELKSIWNDLDIADYTTENYSISYDISDLSLVNTSKDSLFEFLPSHLLGAGIGVLLAGAFPLGIGLLAASVGIAYRQVKTDIDVVKRNVSAKFDAGHEAFIERTSRQFIEQNDMFCKNIENEVNIRIENMEQNLYSIIQTKEESEEEAAKIMENLKEKQSVLERLRRELDEVMA